MKEQGEQGEAGGEELITNAQYLGLPRLLRLRPTLPEAAPTTTKRTSSVQVATSAYFDYALRLSRGQAQYKSLGTSRSVQVPYAQNLKFKIPVTETDS